MAKRRRGRDKRKIHKHERQSKPKESNKYKDDELDELTTHYRPSHRRSKTKRNDMLVVVIAVIFILAVIGVYIFYDQYLEPSQNNSNEPESTFIPTPINGDQEPSNGDITGNPIMIIEIKNFGSIKVELNFDTAPITARNFYDLAVQKKYDGCIFHRVIENFMIQGGDFTNRDGTGGHAAEYHKSYGDPSDPNTWVIPDEFHPDLKNNRGTLSMANSGANTGGSQFFINVVDNNYLDNQHAVFGRIVDGIGIVDEISKVDTSNDRPVNDVIMTRVYEEQSGSI